MIAIFEHLKREFGESVEFTPVTGPPAVPCTAIREDGVDFFSQGTGQIQHYAVTYEFSRSDVPEAFSGALVTDLSRGGVFRVEGELERTEASIKYSVSQVMA